MPRTRQITAIFRPVIVWTWCRSAVFFYLLPRRLEDLDLHDLLAERPLELPDPLLGHPQLTRWDDLLVRRHRRSASFAAQALPLPDQLRGHGQFPSQFGDGQLLASDPRDLLLLKLRGEDPTTIGFPSVGFHSTTLPWEVNLRFPKCLVESGYRAKTLHYQRKVPLRGHSSFGLPGRIGMPDARFVGDPSLGSRHPGSRGILWTDDPSP
jgi:hypothetical protein